MVVLIALLTICATTQAHEVDELALEVAQEAQWLCAARAEASYEQCLRTSLTPSELQALSEHEEQEQDEQAQANIEVHHRYAIDTARRLLQYGTPRASMLAARMVGTLIGSLAADEYKQAAQPLHAEAMAIVTEAVQLGSHDPMLLWTLAGADFRSSTPEVVDLAIARLRALEPANLEVWALGDNNEPWTRERLKRAAASTHHDSKFYDRVRADVELLQLFPLPDALKADMAHSVTTDLGVHTSLAIGIAYADRWLSNLTGLVQRCKTSHADWVESDRPTCTRIAEILTTHSDLTVGTSLGLAMLLNLAADETARTVAEAKRRAYRYQADVLSEWLQQGKHEEQILQRILTPGTTEMSLIRDYIEAAGLPLSPPADWLPLRERLAMRKQQHGR